MDGIDVGEWQYSVRLSVELGGHENVTLSDWGAIISHGHGHMHGKTYVVNSDTRLTFLSTMFYRATL